LSDGLAARVRAAFPAAELVDGFGATETFHVFLTRSSQTGFGPVEGSEVTLVDRAGAPVANDEIGEVVVSGAHNGVGYAGDSTATASVFESGRVHLRDRMVRAPDGRLLYQGRSDAIVKVAGQKVLPAQVAAVIQEHPAVRRAVVETSSNADGLVGLSARVTLHQQSVAFSSLVPELRRFLRERLLPHQCPARFEEGVAQ
jgi:acyl-coenzyme A synthetase/AMP-(fatty) acid ligase